MPLKIIGDPEYPRIPPGFRGQNEVNRGRPGPRNLLFPLPEPEVGSRSSHRSAARGTANPRPDPCQRQNALAIARSAAQDVVSEKAFGEDTPGGTV
jgi:hypothetical protein